MTPKEKAIEILFDFAEVTMDTVPNNLHKQFAYKAIDLKLDSHFNFSGIEYGQDSREYWEQVKIEIENL